MPEFLCESQWPASPARSGRVAVVIAQHAAQALTALDGTRRGALKEDGVSRPHAGLSNGIRRVAFLQEKERLAAMLPASSADNTYRHNAESPTGAALVNMSTAGKGGFLLYTLPVNQRVFSIAVRYPFPIHLESTPYAPRPGSSSTPVRPPGAAPHRPLSLPSQPPRQTYFVRLGEPKFLRPQVSAQRVDLEPFPFGANVSPFRAMSCAAHVSALRFSRAEPAAFRPRLGVNRPVFSPSPEAGYPPVYPREESVNSQAKLTGPRRTR